MFLLRGIEFTYEAVRDWEAKLIPTRDEVDSPGDSQIPGFRIPITA